MRVEWYGQSAFHLSAGEQPVAIDPFGDMSALAAGRGMQFDYPPIVGRGGGPAAGDPRARRPQRRRGDRGRAPRSCARRRARSSRRSARSWRSPPSTTSRPAPRAGPTRSSCSTLDGLRVSHFGDFGQRALREEQAAAIGEIDLLFLPVGGGPTIGAEQAASIVERLSPRWVVPMHYRTPRIGFLETADDFLERFEHVERLSEPAFDTASLPRTDGPLVVVPAAP